MPTSIEHSNLLFRAFSMLLLVTSRLKSNQSLTRLMWFLTVIANLITLVHSSAAQAASLKKSHVISTISEFTAQISQPSPIIFPADGFPTDGRYLYGQSSEAGQIGSTYVVFETRNAMIVGALYMPYSSFDCFYGGIEANQLAMTVISSYDQEAYSYSIPIQPDSAVAAASGSASTNSLSLEGFHRIDTLDEMAQHVLGVCRAEYPDQV